MRELLFDSPIRTRVTRIAVVTLRLYQFSAEQYYHSVKLHRFTMADANDDQNENEQQMIDKVRKFLLNGCGCSRSPKGGPCSNQFSEETVLTNLNNCFELSSAELDLVILANIQVCTKQD